MKTKRILKKNFCRPVTIFVCDAMLSQANLCKFYKKGRYGDLNCIYLSVDDFDMCENVRAHEKAQKEIK